MTEADDADYEIQPGRRGPEPDVPALPAAGMPHVAGGVSARLPDSSGQQRTAADSDDDDEFSLPPLPDPPRPPARAAAPESPVAEESPAGEEQGTAAPDLEAIYAAATGMGAVQADVMEAVTANHVAWYTAWQEAGLTEKRAFALLRVMVREQCRS